MELAATILFNVMVYVFGGYIVARSGGLKKNLPFGFSLLLFSLYHLITPLYFYLSGRETIWGDEDTNKHVGQVITGYYLQTINYYGLANLLFILGYVMIRKKGSTQALESKTIDDQKIRFSIILAFCICFGIVLFNFLNEGLNPFLIIFGSKEDIIAGVTATSNYLKNFSDSIIAVVILGYYFRVNKTILYPMTLVSFVLFALMGFRYRIILTILGILFVNLYDTKYSSSRIGKAIGLIMVVFYFMIFLTYNRFVFVKGNWSELKVNPVEFDYSLFFEQTRGMLDDITIIKYYETDPNPKHDHGVTFLYFLIRAMPRAVVGDEFKNSFYPYPALPIIESAYDVKKHWGKRNTGEAPLHWIYFYIAGGLKALLIGAFLTGLLLRIIQVRYYPVSHWNIVISILLAAGLFQWYTRGYFPGFVDHIAFMLIGMWMIRLLYQLPKITLQ